MPVRETLLTNPNAKIILQGKGLPTRPIGAAALELSGSEHPKVLVITTAADNEGDHDKFVAGAREAFAGAEVNVLHGFGQLPTDTQAQHEIGRHDIRWITGGHSQWAKDRWITDPSSGRHYWPTSVPASRAAVALGMYCLHVRP
jgi:hypothetical protein